MNKYDQALWYEIFHQQVYSFVLPYLSQIDTFFDIGGYKGYFSKYILQYGFKGKIIFIEPVRQFLDQAQTLFYKFKSPLIKNNGTKSQLTWYLNKKQKYPQPIENIVFINAAVCQNLNKSFYQDMEKPGHSGFYLSEAERFLSFFKIKQKQEIKVKVVDFSYLLKYKNGILAAKFDIEGSERDILSDINILKQIDLLVAEYHIFDKEMSLKFEKLKKLLNKVYKKYKINPSNFTDKIGYIFATNLVF